MSIAPVIVKFYSLLYKKNFFTSIKSICELGDQHVGIDVNEFIPLLSLFEFNSEQLAYISSLPPIEPSHITPNYPSARWFYKMLGISEYISIDANGGGGSIPHDLNDPYHPERQYDLITNLGTTEHVFNQWECFNTIHKLCKAGGYIFCSLPYQGHADHGLFLYTWLFYECLIAANNYELLELWIVPDHKDTMPGMPFHMDMIKFDPDATKYIKTGNAGLFVLIKKTSNEDFNTPWQGCYATYQQEKEKNKILLLHEKRQYQEILEVSEQISNDGNVHYCIASALFETDQYSKFENYMKEETVRKSILSTNIPHNKYLSGDFTTFLFNEAPHPLEEYQNRDYNMYIMKDLAELDWLDEQISTKKFHLFIGQEAASSKQKNSLENLAQTYPDQDFLFITQEDLNNQEDLIICAIRASFLSIGLKDNRKYKDIIILRFLYDQQVIYI